MCDIFLSLRLADELSTVLLDIPIPQTGRLYARQREEADSGQNFKKTSGEAPAQKSKGVRRSAGADGA
jgi:hypothetical protein